MRRALVLLLLLIAAAGWLLGWSPYLRIESITVRGVQHVSASEVVATSGVRVGDPLARVTSQRIERSLQSVSRIESVRVERQWPHRLQILITERTPLARVGERVVDRYGVVFALTSDEVQPAMRLEFSKPTRERFVEWFDIYQALPISVRQSISTVRSSTADDITFMTETCTIIWGSAEQTPLKISVLEKLLSQNTAWRKIDLSAPLAPTTSR